MKRINKNSSCFCLHFSEAENNKIDGKNNQVENEPGALPAFQMQVD